jgi:hypothetical protein
MIKFWLVVLGLVAFTALNEAFLCWVGPTCAFSKISTALLNTPSATNLGEDEMIKYQILSDG